MTITPRNFQVNTHLIGAANGRANRYYCDMCDNEIQEFKTVRLGVGGFGFNEETVRQICDDPKCARESITEMMTIIDSKYTAMRAEISAAKAVE